MRHVRVLKAARLTTAISLCMLFTLAATTAFANPPNIPGGAKKVFSFNVLGYPANKSYQGDCGEGHRIFVNRDIKSAQIRVTNSATGNWSIVDCNATADHQAVLETSNATVLDVYVRILGKPGGNIKICANTVEDFEAGETLCLLGSIDLTRGKQSKFSIAPASMFDASLEDLMWSVDTNADFRIAQFRVYQRPVQ